MFTAEEACQGELYFPLALHVAYLSFFFMFPMIGLLIFSAHQRIWYYVKSKLLVLGILIPCVMAIAAAVQVLSYSAENATYFVRLGLFNINQIHIITLFYFPTNIFYFISFMGIMNDAYIFKLTSYVMLYLFWLLESWFEYTYIANNLSKVPVIDWNEHFSVKPENQNPRLKKIIWLGNLIFYVAAALYLNFYCFGFLLMR